MQAISGADSSNLWGYQIIQDTAEKLQMKVVWFISVCSELDNKLLKIYIIK